MTIRCNPRHAPPDPGFAGLRDHSTFTIPWMEDDGGQNEPQFWVNRTLEWARQATAYNARCANRTQSFRHGPMRPILLWTRPSVM